MNGTPSAVVTLTLPRIINVTVTGDTVSVDLEDGRTIAVPIGWYPRLAHGTPDERANVQISGAGYGMHWPDLDEDIGIEGLLVGKQSTESAASFERWLQRRKAKYLKTPPNISSEWTAHSIRFLVIRRVVSCGPPLKLGVRSREKN